MTVRSARFAAFVAVGVLMMAFAQSTVTPAAGIPVGLEHDPEGLVAPRVTDDFGRAEFAVGPGRYSVFLTTPSAPVIVTVTPVNDAPVMVSVPIRPGRGRVYALDAAGRRLRVVGPRSGGRIGVTLTEAGPGPGPRR